LDTRRFRHSRTVALVGALMLAAAGGCAGAKQGGTPVVVTAATAARLTLEPSGSGPVQATVDVPVSLGRSTVTRIHVSLGQQVAAGQPLVDVLLDPARGLAGVVRAPVAGRVAAIVTSADVAGTSRFPHVEIVDDRRITVTTSIPIEYLGMVRQGQSATVSEVGQQQTQTAGVITGVAPVNGTGGQSFQVTIGVDNSAGRFRAGAVANIRLSITKDVPVAVNHLAVLHAEDAPTVFVLRDGKVWQRSVTIGLSDGTTTEVVKGLSAGETVVIAGNQQLTDGAPVTVRDRA
jgi:hypothetical protein